jgi:hypothetical protein
VLPPITTTTRFDPPPFVITTSAITTTVDPPVQTTELIRVSKITVTSELGSNPTKTIQPQPATKPLCVNIDIVIATAKVYPPDLPKLPPVPKISVDPTS